MKAFLICPVRGKDPKKYNGLIAELSRCGLQVYCPALDTNQNDPNGLRICEDNLLAMMAAKIVLVIWDGESQGVLFDLGMAFTLRKPIMEIFMPPATVGKSFQNMVREWQLSLDWKDPSVGLPLDGELHLVRIRKSTKDKVVLATYDEERETWTFPTDPGKCEVVGWY